MSLESKAKTAQQIVNEFTEKVPALDSPIRSQQYVTLEEAQKLEKEIVLWDALASELEQKIELNNHNITVLLKVADNELERAIELARTLQELKVVIEIPRKEKSEVKVNE